MMKMIVIIKSTFQDEKVWDGYPWPWFSPTAGRSGQEPDFAPKTVLESSFLGVTASFCEFFPGHH